MTFPLIATSLALLAMAGPADPQSGPVDDESFFARGLELHQAGDILGAIESYQEALKRAPQRIDARSNLGAAYVRLGRYEEAIEAYRQALAVGPDNATVRFNLALALYKGARIPEAAEELRRVVKQDGTNTKAVLLLADTELQLGNDAAVVSLLTPREGTLGDDRLYAYLLGNALLKRNEIQQGQVWIDRLFRQGETPEARLLMGIAQLRRSDIQSALTEFQRALELNPDLPGARGLEGRSLMLTGRRAEAAASFEMELARNPNDFESNLYLGLLKRDEGQLDLSFDYLKRASRLRPQDPSVLYGLGSVLLLNGRVEEARAALEEVVKAVPSYQQAHVLLATVYVREKKKDLADREKGIVEKLKAEQQAGEAGSQEGLGPAYKGEPDVPEPPRRPDKGSR